MSISVTIGSPTHVSVSVAGGVGPAAEVNTSGVIVGVNPVIPVGGTNITVSQDTVTYTITGVSDSYIAGKSPVQSIQGRTGTVVIVAGDITAGVFDVARIPVLPSQNQVVSTGTISSITFAQESDIVKGTVITTVDGRRWVYGGSGAKTTQANYVELADITPEWTAIANKPSTFTPGVHTHATTDIASFTTSIKTFANVYSVQGKTGTVTLTVQDLSAAASSHSHSTTDITSFTASIKTFANVFSVQGKTGTVTLTVQDLSAAAASHTHSYVLSLNGATGAISIQGGSGVGVTASDGTVTISATSALWPVFIFGG